MWARGCACRAPVVRVSCVCLVCCAEHEGGRNGTETELKREGGGASGALRCRGWQVCCTGGDRNVACGQAAWRRDMLWRQVWRVLFCLWQMRRLRVLWWVGDVRSFTAWESPVVVIFREREEHVFRLWMGFCIKPQESFARSRVCAERVRDCLQEELTDSKLHSCIMPAMGVRVSLWFRRVGIWLPCAVRSFFIIQ